MGGRGIDHIKREMHPQERETSSNASACFFFSDHVFARPQVLDEAFRRGGNHAEDEDASHHCKVSGCITNTPCRRIACRLRDAGRRHGAHAGMHAQSALPVC